MLEERDTGKINDREKELYSRNPVNRVPKVDDIRPSSVQRPQATFTVPSGSEWKEDAFSEAVKEDYLEPEEVKSHSGFFKKFFFGAVVFFIAALGAFFYMQYGGFNSVSTKNVDILIKGPVAVNGGEELVLDVSVTNGNNVDMTTATLTIEYPSGTRDPNDITKDKDREVVEVGAVKSGQSGTKTVKAVLFGEKDSIKNIKFYLEYGVVNSNATFTKEKSLEIGIKSAPIILSLDSPEEVNSNQQMQLDLTLTSNSSTVIENVLISGQYPFGFAFQESDPMPTFDTNIWSVGNLKPNETKKISIVGIMQGQNEEEKTFRFTAGTAASAEDKIASVDFMQLSESTKIKKPFFTSSLSLEGDETDNPVTDINSQVTGAISFSNSVPVTIHDIVVEVIFSGNAIDRNRILARDNGFYESATNRIFWDKRTMPALAEFEPGQSGNLQFDFYTLKPTPQLFASLRNPQVKMDVKITGKRFSETEAPEELTYSFSKIIRINSEAQYNPRLVYSQGPFTNTGPIPPKAENTTTYTVIWGVSNSFNDLTDGSVTTTLPPYVKFVGTKNPASANIIYNKETNQVVWDVGDIKAGQGYGGTPPVEVAFQVSFVPSLSQVGDAPDLINESRFEATDRFTGTLIELTNTELSSRISTDPAFDFGDGTVVK
jgi:hypothetical protein